MTLSVALAPGGYPINAVRLDGTSTNRTVEASSGTSQQSAAFGNSTVMIRISFVSANAGDAIRFAVGPSPTASATSALLPAGVVEYIHVKPAWKIAVLSNDADTQTLNIVEITDVSAI